MSAKGQAQYRHFLKRAKQRLDITLTKSQYLELLTEVENRMYPVYGKTVNKRKLFIWVHKYKQDFMVIYDIKYHRLVTVYTYEMIQSRKDIVKEKKSGLPKM